MLKTGVVLLFSLVVLPAFSSAQSPQVLDAHGRVSIRGLSAPGNGVVWVSGSGGTVGRSTDAGLHWTWMTVAGHEHTDFRDVEGFDSSTAVIMGVDTPAIILKTRDGGASWQEAFHDDTKGMFLDAMSFAVLAGGQHVGIVVGDPVMTPTGNRFFLAVSADTGNTWGPVPLEFRPKADSGEGCFASSGTNILLFQSNGGTRLSYPFVTGGPVSRISEIDSLYPLPLLQGTASTGANSLGMDGNHWVVVGGDFAHDTVTKGNCVYSTDGGKHWLAPQTRPHGYRSCVIHLWKDTWLCCGTSGVDVTSDGGNHWKQLSSESFHVAAYPGSGRTVYLAGGRGRVAKLEF